MTTTPHFFYSLPSASSTSTSNSSITPSITPRLSMNPFTATRSMRFVVARYVVSRIAGSSGWGSDPDSFGEDVTVSSRRTKGESSVSTSRVRRADEARRAVGRGMEIVLRRGCVNVWFYALVWDCGVGGCG